MIPAVLFTVLAGLTWLLLRLMDRRLGSPWPIDTERWKFKPARYGQFMEYGTAPKRASYLKAAISNGLLTPNEARAEAGIEPIADVTDPPKHFRAKPPLGVFLPADPQPGDIWHIGDRLLCWDGSQWRLVAEDRLCPTP